MVIRSLLDAQESLVIDTDFIIEDEPDGKHVCTACTMIIIIIVHII